MTHAEFKPHGFITLSNTGGIEVMLNRSNDGVFYRFNYGQDNIEQEEIFEAEIVHEFSEEEAEEGEQDNIGFIHETDNGNTFYPLSICMRINQQIF